MRPTVRRFFIVVVTEHGLLHLLGAAKGLGLAEVDQSITVPMGLLWLLAAPGVLAAAILVVRGAYRRWPVTAAAAIGSQVVISTSWAGAKTPLWKASTAPGFHHQGAQASSISTVDHPSTGE